MVQLDAASLNNMYGSFFLGGDEFALAAESIREVVKFPEKITSIPLSPAYLEGVFTLRGNIIPVLNLMRIFNPADASAASPTQTIVIVDHRGIQIGLLFDSIGEIMRVRIEQCSQLEYPDKSTHNVVCGTIRLSDGLRLLQILDPNSLVSIKNIPQLVALKNTGRQAQGNHFQLQTERRRCMSFKVGETAFAFEMDAIREIIQVPEIQSSVLCDKLCLGRINLRGNVVAVIDFAQFLHVGERNNVDPTQQRIIIACIGNASIGLLVDSVDNLLSFFPSDLLPIPLLSETRAGMFSGCIIKNESGAVILLNHSKMFTQAEMVAITRGHNELYQDKPGQDKDQIIKNSTGLNRKVYTTFNIGSAYAFEIGKIREIIHYSNDLIRPPNVPDFIRGVMNLRRQMITLIDLRRLYDMPALLNTDNAKVLIIEHERERYGLVVDSVESIITVADSDRYPAPKMMRTHQDGDMRSEMQEVVNIDDDAGARTTLTVFEVETFLIRLKRGMSMETAPAIA